MKNVTYKQKNALMCLLAILIACIFLFPLYWIVVNSFKLDSEIFAGTPTLWPKEFTLKAYQDQLGNLRITMKNSILIAAGSMILSLCLSVPAAYGLARYHHIHTVHRSDAPARLFEHSGGTGGCGENRWMQRD